MKLAKKLQCIVLCLIIIAASCFVSMPVLAEDIPEYGTVNVSDWLYVRASASVSAAEKGRLYAGNKVKILEKVKTNDKDYPEWYKISVENDPSLEGGYVAAKFITPIIVYTPEADFEKYLTDQGFPESYKPMLRELHANYPKWVFIADHLEMTWDKALTEESVVGHSLIDGSEHNSWKSMEYGAYNWATGQFVTFDSGGWVTAHKSVVAYYLDPRNFIDSTNIFQFFMQTYVPELQTADGLKKLVSGTFLAKDFPEETHETYVDVIMEAAQKSGVSPYVIASMILTEQGTNGTGNSISGNISGYKGYYNFFNVNAYRSGSIDAITNGLIYASSGSTYMRPWNTRAKSIIGGALWYYNDYVNPATSGGYTIYYKKFDVKKSPYYTFEYMTNIRGAAIEGAKSAKGYSAEDLKNALEFRIPVYKNMPDEISPLPPKKGNNDNYLGDLAVEGHSFTTDFSRWKNDYEMIVDYSVSSVNITARASNTYATVAGTGQVSLVVGTNKLNVVVTASSGHTRTYNIVITRKENEGEKPPEPTIETTEYNIGQFIMGVDLNTTPNSFIEKLKVKNGTVKLFNADGSEKTGGIVGTGNVVKIYDSEQKEKVSYQIVIYGDINGDGKIQLSDIVQMRGYYVGDIEFSSNAVIKAMDVNRSGNFTLADIVRIRSHYVGDITISQK